MDRESTDFKLLQSYLFWLVVAIAVAALILTVYEGIQIYKLYTVADYIWNQTICNTTACQMAHVIK